MTIADGLIGIVGAIVLGSLMAAAVAVGLSPLSPIGPVRPVYPTPGIAFDWTVLGLGLVVLIVVLVGGSVALALRRPRRAAPTAAAHVRSVLRPRCVSQWLRPSRTGSRRGAVRARSRAAAGPQGQFAPPCSAPCWPYHRRRHIDVRRELADPGVRAGPLRVELELRPAAGYDPVSYTPPQFQSLLRRDLDVDDMDDGAVLYSQRRRSGRAFHVRAARLVDCPAAIVRARGSRSGPSRDRPGDPCRLHKRVGDTVKASYEGQQGTLRIVGTATFPAIGINGTFHPSTGTGAIASTQILPRTPTPSAASRRTWCSFGCVRRSRPLRLWRTHNGSRTDTNRIFASVPASSNCSDDLVAVLPVQRPAEIADYRSVGTTPAVLAAALVLAAMIALGLTLAASVRRRRRDLATLKALGFTRRQLLSTVCWQSSVVGRHRDRRRRAAWHRARTMAVDVVRPLHLCRSGADRTVALGDPRRHWRAGLRQPRCHHSRTHRR